VPSSGTTTFRYLHGDHLGSVAASSTSNTSPTVTKQYFTPWGEQRTGTNTSAIPSQTTERNFTGQRKDTTGLLFYNARYYDPKLSRFISADSIVPGMASGAGGMGSLGVDDKTGSMLTVDFHETQFAMGVGAENAFTREKGFQFELSEEGKYQGGPPNPQALNRYSYGLNNPVKYTDPTGHDVYLTHDQAKDTVFALRQMASDLGFMAALTDIAISSGTGGVLLWLKTVNPTLAAAFMHPAGMAVLGLVVGGVLAAGVAAVYFFNRTAEYIEHYNGAQGVMMRRYRDTYLIDSIWIVDRSSGKGAVVSHPNVPDEFRMGVTFGDNPLNGRCRWVENTPGYGCF
jgi:RHS repeat-associated protein